MFEAAHTGTLFLDEIGELDSRMQAKLLRVLDGHSYFRLGGSRKVVADVRIVAATNLNLEEAVQSGKFRRDLFHRLDAFHLRVPPLRERTEDIGPLARWFLRETIPGLSDEALAILEDLFLARQHPRTQKCLNKAALCAAGAMIEPGDLPVELLLCSGSDRIAARKSLFARRTGTADHLQSARADRRPPAEEPRTCSASRAAR